MEKSRLDSTRVGYIDFRRTHLYASSYENACDVPYIDIVKARVRLLFKENTSLVIFASFIFRN